MNNTQLIINIDEEGWNSSLTNVGELSNYALTTVFNYIQSMEDLDFWNGSKPILVNLCLSNDAKVQELNRDFRKIDKPTNVLSFANIDDENFAEDCEIYDEIELGDIIIALETMQREAELKKISLHDHYIHLLTHGLLHLLGFDHIENEEAEYMEGCEIQILQQLNIKNPYAE